MFPASRLDARKNSNSAQQMTASTLLNYLDHFQRSHEKECRGPDIRRYAQYYAFMQGLLYIFCFRWADFIDEEKSSSRIDRDDPARPRSGRQFSRYSERLWRFRDQSRQGLAGPAR